MLLAYAEHRQQDFWNLTMEDPWVKLYMQEKQHTMDCFQPFRQEMDLPEAELSLKAMKDF